MEPAQVSPIWLAQLFAILSIAFRLDSASASDMSPSTDAHLGRDLFLRASANALVLGKYKTPQRHAVEALLLYSQSRYISNLDSVQELWTSFGVIVRLAMLMGYHRDAQHLTGMSAYEGEMRRRTWAVIQQLDVLHSFQIGLPSFIHCDVCDAEIPHNLTDNDFDEFTAHLPASKPDSETTDILYFIVRSRMLNLVREVIRLSLTLNPVPYDEVMENGCSTSWCTRINTPCVEETTDITMFHRINTIYRSKNKLRAVVSEKPLYPASEVHLQRSGAFLVKKFMHRSCLDNSRDTSGASRIVTTRWSAIPRPMATVIRYTP